MKYKHNNKNTGFTLLELLVSITIFAVMSVMAYGGLSSVISNSESSKMALTRLQEVQQTMVNIERDFSQIAKRDIRDEFGSVRAYLITDDNSDLLIEFTRNGRRNPAGLLRSNMVRVAYKLENGDLKRLYWPQLDRVQGMLPHENTLLSNVTIAELQFLDSNNEWHSQWPPLNASATPNNTSLALTAIEYKITLEDWGEISRLFKVQG